MRRWVVVTGAMALVACKPPSRRFEGASSPQASATATEVSKASTKAPASSADETGSRFERCTIDDSDRDDRTWPAISQPMVAEAIALPSAARNGTVDAARCERGDEEACLRLAKALHRAQEPAAADVYRFAADLAFDRRAAQGPRVSAPPSPTDVAGALEAFRRAWYGEILPRLDPKRHELPHALADCMAGDPFYTVSLIEHRLAYRMSYMVMHAHEEGGGAHLLLHGEIEDLVGDGDLWMVFYGGSLPDRPPSSSFAAYVDADTGRLLLVVELPEG